MSISCMSRIFFILWFHNNPWFNPKGGNKQYITESANKSESNMSLMSSQLGEIFAKRNRLYILSERDIILSALFQLPLSLCLSLYSTYKKHLCCDVCRFHVSRVFCSTITLSAWDFSLQDIWLCLPVSSCIVFATSMGSLLRNYK